MVDYRSFLYCVAAFGTIILLKVSWFSELNDITINELSTDPPPDKYPIIVIDAGSSGSRAHIFHPAQVAGTIEPRHESLKIKPGLSSYAENPQDAGPSLEPLLEFIRKELPELELRQHTKILLKATAGMRLLTKEQQEAIMASVSKFLHEKTELEFVIAEVIDGEEEGVLGWTAVNFLNNNPEVINNDLWSVVEMGGASVQVTVPISDGKSGLRANTPAIPDSLQRKYQLSKTQRGQVYTHSFLGLGMESARKEVNRILADIKAPEDPCLNTGYDGEGYVEPANGIASAKPKGDGDKCRELIKKTLFPIKPEENLENDCKHSQGCILNGLPALPIDLNSKLWGFENVFYTPSALGLQGEITFQDLLNKGTEICKMDWATMDPQYPKDQQPKDINEKWCFGSMYLYTFFVEGLKLDPSMKITVSNDVNGNGIDWSLGAALHQAQIQG